MIVVSDNSVLSCLAEIGELDLLRRLYGKVTITATIGREAVHASAPAALRELFLKTPDWISVVPAGLLKDAAMAGLIDFEDAFSRLSQTGFRLSPHVVETLRQSLADGSPPPTGG